MASKQTNRIMASYYTYFYKSFTPCTTEIDTFLQCTGFYKALSTDHKN